MATQQTQDDFNSDIYDDYLTQYLALPPTPPEPIDLEFIDPEIPEIKDPIPPLDYDIRIKPMTEEERRRESKKRSDEMQFRRLLCYDYPDPEEDPPEDWRPPIYWINSRIDTRFLQQARFPKRRYDLITKGYLPPIEVPEIEFYTTLHKLLKDNGFERVYFRMVYYGFNEVFHLYDWDIEVCDYLIEDIIDNDNDDDYWWDKWISKFVEILKSYKRVIVA